MRPEDFILVSVDDHVVEPPTVFDRHLTPEWKPKAPRNVRKADGSNVWVWQGEQIPNIALNAVVGRPPEEYGMEPTSYEQLRPGTYDVRERIRVLLDKPRDRLHRAFAAAAASFRSACCRPGTRP